MTQRRCVAMAKPLRLPERVLLQHHRQEEKEPEVHTYFSLYISPNKLLHTHADFTHLKITSKLHRKGPMGSEGVQWRDTENTVQEIIRQKLKKKKKKICPWTFLDVKEEY